MKFTYLLINFFTIFIPLIFSFHPKIRFHTYFRNFLIADLIIAAIFITWDHFFTASGIWGFNPQYTVGLSIAGLPIEEILFFICIPFACVFTYYCLNQFFEIRWTRKSEQLFLTGFCLLLLVTGFLNSDKAYTASVCFSTAGLILFLKFIARATWLPKFFTIYPLLLIPFFFVNGILTGSWIEEPVVWYNNSENLGIRLFTIPVEDVFYGFELLVAITAIFEFLKNSSKSSVQTEALHA